MSALASITVGDDDGVSFTSPLLMELGELGDGYRGRSDGDPG